MSQSVGPFSDGTPQASQWPIPVDKATPFLITARFSIADSDDSIKPRHFYDYEIHPQVGEAGTYFYHSHVDFQATSAAGPLIVEEASGNSAYDYEEERTLFVSELFNKTDAEIVSGLAEPLSQFIW